jgi:ATP-dependent Clp protease ATP-binding subunit ClpX
VKYALGARGLRSLCEAILTDAMYELPSTNTSELKITKRYAENKLSVVQLSQLKAAS